VEDDGDRRHRLVVNRANQARRWTQAADAFRQVAGAFPTSFLNARLNAASDS